MIELAAGLTYAAGVAVKRKIPVEPKPARKGNWEEVARLVRDA